MERGCFGKECCSKFLRSVWVVIKEAISECVFCCWLMALVLLLPPVEADWFSSLSVLSLTRFPASLRLSCHASESWSEWCVICDSRRGCWWNTSSSHTCSLISGHFPRFLLQLSSSSSVVSWTQQVKLSSPAENCGYSKSSHFTGCLFVTSSHL